MFENMTYDYILQSMLDRIPDTIDKREGSIIYDALAPAALELENIYTALDMIVNEAYADTASYEYLAKRCAERGILPQDATKAVLKGTFTPVTVEIPSGSRFSLDALNYIITEKITNGTYKLECETEGEEGNKYLGSLIPIDYVEGLETATLTEVLVPGQEIEEEESLRNRYFSSFKSTAFGGNVADYIEKTNAIAGVGETKVVRAWNGGGTVKLIIINSNFQKPSTELVDTVQNEIDPIEHSGDGVGIAPIGHIVTVVGVENKIVNITATITYQDGWSFDSAKDYINDAIDTYFLELSKSWGGSDNLIVRISQLESRILNCAGVLDITGTKLNDVAQNLTLESQEIPVRGDVVG